MQRVYITFLAIICFTCTAAHAMNINECIKRFIDLVRTPQMQFERWDEERIQAWYSRLKDASLGAERDFDGISPEIDKIRRLQKWIASAQSTRGVRHLHNALNLIVSDQKLFKNDHIQTLFKETAYLLMQSDFLPNGWSASIEKLLQPLSLPEIHSKAALGKFLFSSGERPNDVNWFMKGLRSDAPGKYVVYNDDEYEIRSAPIDKFIPAPERLVLCYYTPSGARANQALKLYEHATRWVSKRLKNPKAVRDVETFEEFAHNVLREKNLELAERPNPAFDRPLLEAVFRFYEELDASAATETKMPNGSPAWFIPSKRQTGKGILFPITGVDVNSLYSTDLNMDPEFRNLIIISILAYHSQTQLDQRAQKTAHAFFELQKKLAENEYYLRINPHKMGGFDIGSDTRKHEVITSHTGGPFHLDENWITRWSEYPAKLRAIFLETFPKDWFALSAAFRVLRTLKEYPPKKPWNPGYRLGARYIPFVADFVLLPDEIKKATCDHLTPKQQVQWRSLVDEFQNAR